MSSAQFATLLLNKVINESDFAPIIKYKLAPADMPSKRDANVLRFIKEYHESQGTTPSYATVAAQVADFEYVPEVSDSFGYLAKKVKDYVGKVGVFNILEAPDINDKFNSMSAVDFIEHIQSQLHEVELKAKIADGIGTNLAHDGSKFVTEYEKRKAGESSRVWQSKFATINKELGGYTEGNIYGWYGRSGRGKSIVTMEEALQSAIDGANVLVWALEMPWFEWMARAYSSLSARRNLFKAEVDGTFYESGFFNRDLQQGDLDPEFETAFKVFTQELAEGQHMKGTLTLRAVDDDEFDGRNLTALQADIEATQANVVVIDPIYYMDFEQNTSKTAGGDVAETSKKLRRLAGRTKTVIHIVTQAEEDKNEKGGEDRQINVPSRDAVKKSKAILEDSASLFAFDSVGKTGVIAIKKGRSGGEDIQAELVFMPSYGVVKEIDYKAALVGEF